MRERLVPARDSPSPGKNISDSLGTTVLDFGRGNTENAKLPCGQRDFAGGPLVPGDFSGDFAGGPAGNFSGGLCGPKDLSKGGDSDGQNISDRGSHHRSSVSAQTPMLWVRSKLEGLRAQGIPKLVGKAHTLACAHPLCEIPSGTRTARVSWVNPVSRRGMEAAERLVQASLDLSQVGDKVPAASGVQWGPAACEKGETSPSLGSEGIGHSETAPTEKNVSVPNIRHALEAYPSSPCTPTADQGSPVQVYQVASPRMKTGRYGLGEGPDCNASSINHAGGCPCGPESHGHQGPWYPPPVQGRGADVSPPANFGCPMGGGGQVPFSSAMCTEAPDCNPSSIKNAAEDLSSPQHLGQQCSEVLRAGHGQKVLSSPDIAKNFREIGPEGTGGGSFPPLSEGAGEVRVDAFLKIFPGGTDRTSGADFFPEIVSEGTEGGSCHLGPELTRGGAFPEFGHEGTGGESFSPVSEGTEGGSRHLGPDASLEEVPRGTADAKIFASEFSQETVSEGTEGGSCHLGPEMTRVDAFPEDVPRGTGVAKILRTIMPRGTENTVCVGIFPEFVHEGRGKVKKKSKGGDPWTPLG